MKKLRQAKKEIIAIYKESKQFDEKTTCEKFDLFENYLQPLTKLIERL